MSLTALTKEVMSCAESRVLEKLTIKVFGFSVLMSNIEKTLREGRTKRFFSVESLSFQVKLRDFLLFPLFMLSTEKNHFSPLALSCHVTGAFESP